MLEDLYTKLVRDFQVNNLNDLYEQAYSLLNASAEGLETFQEKFFFHPLLNKYKRLSPEILEVGCGTRSIFSKWNFENQKVISCDFSKKAIELAPNEDKNLGIEYFHLDVTKKWPKIGPFDFVFDAHCIHCITSYESRKSYLESCYKNLKNGGRVFLDVLCQVEQMNFPDDFLYIEETETLYQQIKEAPIPVRYICRPKSLEFLILECGFEIEYFKIVSNRKILVHNRRDFALETDPCSLICVLKKAI